MANLQLKLTNFVRKTELSVEKEKFVTILKRDLAEFGAIGTKLKPEISTVKVSEDDKGKTYRTSVQFNLSDAEAVRHHGQKNFVSLLDAISKTFLTPQEVQKLLTDLLNKGDLVNTQGTKSYVKVRFQDPRQPKLSDEAYIAFDFDYTVPKTLEDHVSELEDTIKKHESLIKELSDKVLGTPDENDPEKDASETTSTTKNSEDSTSTSTSTTSTSTSTTTVPETGQATENPSQAKADVSANQNVAK